VGKSVKGFMESGVNESRFPLFALELTQVGFFLKQVCQSQNQQQRESIKSPVWRLYNPPSPPKMRPGT